MTEKMSKGNEFVSVGVTYEGHKYLLSNGLEFFVQPVDCHEQPVLHGRKCYRVVCGGAVQVTTEKMTKVNEFGSVEVQN